jgi:UDP-3-O-[3-hydroxymyristoyl] glucosamine N-acyltransferase
MKFKNPISASWLANFIGAKIIGNENLVATGINEINRVEVGDIVFVDHPKYYDKCLQSTASFIIINNDVDCPMNKVLLVVEKPFDAYEKITKHFGPTNFQKELIHDTATIDASALIYPNVVIGANVVIGKNVTIYPNSTIYENTIIGDNVIIQSNTVIGSNAFYYNTKKDREMWYNKMHSCGGVILENNVEIGACCTIDKGVSSNTIIGAGTKMDNHCHIGHDVIIGKNCLLAAQVGVAGATTLEDGVTLWGQVGVNKTTTIGANAIVMGQSGVVSDIEGGKVYWGTPAIDVVSKKRELVWINRIPELWAKIKNYNP